MSRIAQALIALGSSAPRVALITTGVGAGAQASLWGTPGGSNFFVGAEMPYLQREIDRVLGFTPERYCSAETAVDLALAAYLRASEPGHLAIGIGCTGKVASVEAHKGPHKIVVAVIGPAGCTLFDAEIPKGEGEGQRALDGEIAGAMILNALAHAAELRTVPRLPYPGRNAKGEIAPVHVRERECSSLVRERIFARPFFTATGTRELASVLDPATTVYYPGSFNPPHPGHLGAAENARQKLASFGWHRRRLVFATCATAVHKPVLSVTAMLDRVAQMRGRDFLLTEGDPLFIDKARKNPGAIFLLGADVFATMIDPSWGIDTQDLLEEYRRLGTRFLVVGRLYKGRFLTLDDLLDGGATTAIPDVYHSLFLPVPGRWDLSSSGREPGTCAAAPAPTVT